MGMVVAAGVVSSLVSVVILVCVVSELNLIPALALIVDFALAGLLASGMVAVADDAGN